MKITFREFRSFLTEEGCSEAEIRQLYRTVKSMDAESRGWVIRWFCTSELPEDEIEGVTARDLIDKFGYKPLNAFIVLDWLKTDPQEAKYFMMKIPSTISPSDSIGQEIAERLRREGQKVQAYAADVDESDIGE